MNVDCCHEILKAEGFERIGTLECDVRMGVYWHGQHRLELAVVNIADAVLLRGTKYYRLKARGEGGETLVRDLGSLEEYLVGHFSEVCIQLCSFRDPSEDLVRRAIAERSFRHVRQERDADAGALLRRIQELRSEYCAAEETHRRDEKLLRLNTGRPGLLKEMIGRRAGRRQRELQELRAQHKDLASRLETQEQLERQYGKKTDAVCLLLSICSVPQLAIEPPGFPDALAAVVKELLDADRYQVRQQFEGGRFQIFLEAVDVPGVTLLTRWTGALFSAAQLQNLGPQSAELKDAVERHCELFARRDIVLGGAVQDQKKLVTARVVRNFLKRLEKVPAPSSKPTASPNAKMPVWIGNVHDLGRHGSRPWELPLDRAGHICLSGRTGSGKSFLAFVIAEGAAGYEKLAIVILDPVGQWVGLRRAEDRREVLERYGQFGLDPEQARGFAFAYHGVGNSLGDPLPGDLGDLARGRHVIDLSGLDDERRCRIAAEVQEAIFERCARSESDRPRVLVAIEEILRLTRKGVAAEAKDAAAACEQKIDRLAREGRKHGVSLMLIGQSNLDLARALSTVRQNIGTRIFMVNTDKEIEYAGDFLDDPRAIVALQTGEALIHNPVWGVARVVARPPLSKPWQPSERQLHEIVAGKTVRSRTPLSSTARAVLETARRLRDSSHQAVRYASVLEQLEITSQRKAKEILEEIQRMGAARFQQLPQRGRPLVIVPTHEEMFSSENAERDAEEDGERRDSAANSIRDRRI